MLYVAPIDDRATEGALRIQISLVSIAVKIFPATQPGRQIEFHQIDRKTHKRVHHQNVDEAGGVDRSDIVKRLRVPSPADRRLRN